MEVLVRLRLQTWTPTSLAEKVLQWPKSQLFFSTNCPLSVDNINAPEWTQTRSGSLVCLDDHSGQTCRRRRSVLSRVSLAVASMHSGLPQGLISVQGAPPVHRKQRSFLHFSEPQKEENKQSCSKCLDSVIVLYSSKHGAERSQKHSSGCVKCRAFPVCLKHM